MVRLKVLSEFPYLIVISLFQFQYGTIKREDKDGKKYPLDYGFNSNMVRLKEVNRNSINALESQFQFQYGTIKS